MKWSETIKFNAALRDVRLLTNAPSQDWSVHLREREDAAYQNGRRDGERALSEQLLQQRSDMVELQNGILDSLRRTLPQMIQETESALINLALEAAQKIIAGMPVEVSLVEAVVRDALRQIEDTAEIVIQLHPDDFTLLHKHKSALLKGVPETGPVRFAASPEVTRGGCIVQTRFGMVDARRETKLEQLRKTLNP
jgi:flagellar assembly protein FliH